MNPKIAHLRVVEFRGIEVGQSLFFALESYYFKKVYRLEVTLKQERRLQDNALLLRFAEAGVWPQICGKNLAAPTDARLAHKLSDLNF